MKKIISYLFFICLFSIAWTSNVFAADPEHKCSILVNIYNDKESFAVSEQEVFIVKVADRKEDGTYSLAQGFENSGISLSAIMERNSQYAEDIYEFVKDNDSIIKQTALTDVSGKAKFEELSQGVYLIASKEGQRYSFHPYLIMLPSKVNGNDDYDVETTPKTKDTYLKQIHVKIIWDDLEDIDKKRPENVIVILNRNGEVYSQTMISKNENWEYVFENLPEGNYTYSIIEENVPEYTSKVTGEAETGFVITYRYRPDDETQTIPQTGENRVLVYSLMGGGTVTVVAGIFLYLLGSNKKYENE